tara:strand:+ start:290 stop:487 length:198 start_codon:yes stop_codon:yes gene_type:complete
MEDKTPPNIILHKSKEVIFYISKDNKRLNIELWKQELNLLGYKGFVIHSKCIFNRLKNDSSLGEN